VNSLILVLCFITHDFNVALEKKVILLLQPIKTKNIELWMTLTHKYDMSKCNDHSNMHAYISSILRWADWNFFCYEWTTTQDVCNAKVKF